MKQTMSYGHLAAVHTNPKKIIEFGALLLYANKIMILLQNRVDLVGSPRTEDKSTLEFINEIEVLKRRIRELEERPGRLQTIPGEQEEENDEKVIILFCSHC